MISRKSRNPRKRLVEGDYSEVGEIKFPPLLNISLANPVIIKAYVSRRQVNRVYLDNGSLCEVIYEHCILKLKPSIRSLRVDSKTPLVGFSGEQSWPLGEVPLEITIGEGPLTVTKTLNFGIVSEIQNLSRKLADLNRFLLKGADKTLPFIRTLKSGTSEKMVQCITETDEAFRRMKELLEALPTIKFRERNLVKGQILADFLAETPSMGDREIKDEEAKRKEPEPKNAWKLFTDEASSSDGSGKGLILEVLVEVVQDKSITEREVADVTKEEGDSWMLPIWEYLQLGKLPDDPKKERKLRIKDPLYKIIDGTLYRRSYLSPFLRLSRIIRMGYYWPSMHKDAKTLIQKCETCQIHSPIPRKPKQEMTNVGMALLTKGN
ncbi:reverse transcriptase domain-containing protein [Tanacetum coccineum]